MNFIQINNKVIMETKYLKINPADNVAVAIVTLPGRRKAHGGRDGNHSE